VGGPADAATREDGEAPVLALRPGHLLVRIHKKKHSAIFFGPAPGRPPGNRFDAPNGAFRVLYAAERLEGAYVETVLRHGHRQIVTRAHVNERAWSTLRIERPVRLAALLDEGLFPHGVDAGELGAEDYAFCRALALRLYQTRPDLDGLAYRSRFNNGEVCYAVFDRVANGTLATLRTDAFEDHPERADALMRYYRARFHPSTALGEDPPPE